MIPPAGSTCALQENTVDIDPRDQTGFTFTGAIVISTLSNLIQTVMAQFETIRTGLPVDLQIQDGQDFTLTSVAFTSKYDFFSSLKAILFRAFSIYG